MEFCGRIVCVARDHDDPDTEECNYLGGGLFRTTVRRGNPDLRRAHRIGSGSLGGWSPSGRCRRDKQGAGGTAQAVGLRSRFFYSRDPIIRGRRLHQQLEEKLRSCTRDWNGSYRSPIDGCEAIRQYYGSSFAVELCENSIQLLVLQCMALVSREKRPSRYTSPGVVGMKPTGSRGTRRGRCTGTRKPAAVVNRRHRTVLQSPMFSIIVPRL